MNIEQVREYALSLLGVTEDQPFGDDIITFRLEGKISLSLHRHLTKVDSRHDSTNHASMLVLAAPRIMIV